MGERGQMEAMWGDGESARPIINVLAANATEAIRCCCQEIVGWGQDADLVWGPNSANWGGPNS